MRWNWGAGAAPEGADVGAEYEMYSYRSGGYMKVRIRSFFAALLVTGSVVACRGESPSPMAPAAVSLDKRVQDAKSSDTVTVYTRRTPFATDVSVSDVIGSNGGVLDLKAAGLKIFVPKGAVSSPMTFSITALAGGLVAYEFTPHMVFAQPIRIEQQLNELNVPSSTVGTVAGYFADRADLGVSASDVGAIQEELPVTVDQTGGKAKFTVSHFSGYLMASGRR
jgi:hypothetical protein